MLYSIQYSIISKSIILELTRGGINNFHENIVPEQLNYGGGGTFFVAMFPRFSETDKKGTKRWELC